MANYNKTPLLRPLRPNGSTLYMFPSAQEDIGLNINSSAYGAALSSYALLNLNKQNFNFTSTQALAKDLQNYLMNFETTLLNESDYDFQQPGTVSEKVFWHWMKKNGMQIEEIILDDTHTGIYREKNYRCDDANRIVQGFGQIDAGNSLSTEFGMFNETYVTVPTSYGNGPVFFRLSDNYEDTNYVPGTYPSGLEPGSVYIQGRSATDYTYVGDAKAIYDDMDNRKYVVTQGDTFEIVKDFKTISSILTKMNGGHDITVDSWDDINIDNLNAFKDIERDDEHGGAYDMSKECEFKFNAILLYYSVYDIDDEFKQAISTNLFGIVFIDGGASQSGGDYMIAPFLKRKSFQGQSGTQAYFGNSYSFRVNMKTLSVYDNTDARIDDKTSSNSMYVQDFNDVVSALNRSVDMMNYNTHTINSIQDRYQAILASYTELRDDLNELPKKITTSVMEQVDEALKTMSDELKQYTDDQIDALKDRLGLIDDTTEIIIDKQDTANGLYGSSLRTTNIYTLGASENREKMQRIPQEDVLNSMIANAVALRMDSILNEMGIVQITGILQPRSKKPEVSGKYLKQNTRGIIDTWVEFDGEEYSEPMRCEAGKIYSVNSLNYQFNGRTCKVIGADIEGTEAPNKKDNNNKK